MRENNNSGDINKIIDLYKDYILPSGLDEDDLIELRNNTDKLFSSNPLPMLTNIYEAKMYNLM